MPPEFRRKAPRRGISLGGGSPGGGSPGGHPQGVRAWGGPSPGGGATRVLIDGRNVQFALARRASGPRGGVGGAGFAGRSGLPTTSLIARLRAAFSPPTEVELILDGHAGGSPAGRIAPAFTVSFTRHATADQVIGERVTEALRELGPAGAWSVLVVTDDREVRGHARRNGARVEGTAWLAERLAAPTGPPGRPGTSIGQGRPPRTRRSG